MKKFIIGLTTMTFALTLFAAPAFAMTPDYPYLTTVALQVMDEAEKAGLNKIETANLIMYVAGETYKLSPEALDWCEAFVKSLNIVQPH